MLVQRADYVNTSLDELAAYNMSASRLLSLSAFTSRVRLWVSTSHT